MTDVIEFRGRILSSTPCELGEGPSFDSATGLIWWFSILEKKLYSLDPASKRETVADLPLMASVAAPVDAERQMLATEKGIFIRSIETGELALHCEIEADNPGTRCNDGRLHPSGALWFGTMGRRAETGAGSIYHIAEGQVTKLFSDISIPNSICFSPDGRTGYYVDTKINRLMSVDLDPSSGLPKDKPRLLIDGSGAPGGIDGSICDADGSIYNARWGQGAVDRYAPDGRHIARYRLPATQTSCPVVIGNGRLAVTSALEGMDAAARAADPKAGYLFELEAPVTLQETIRYAI